jgi:tetratricopeptide (TPR) repeat protein
MKKFFGLALVPVLLASTPMLALAEQTHHGAATPQQHQQMTQRTTHQQMHQTHQQQMQQKKAQPGMTQQTTGMQSTTDARINQQWVQARQSLITKHYPEAINAYQNVLSVQPNNIHALQGLSIALYSQGRYDEALQTINKAIAADPVNSQLFYTKAQILDAQDKHLEALEAYLTFTAMAPDDAASLMAQRRANELHKIVEPRLSQGWQNYLQGLQYLSLHQPQQAIQYFEKYQSLEPNNPVSGILLGQAYLDMGQPDKAIPYFESAVKLKADNPLAYYRLGSSYELRGESQNANTAFRKFLQFAPQSEAAIIINRRMEHQAQ